ncbi:lectin-like domain-containing protein [Streptomyces sp. NBC_01304]|uniref:lectin-like domain-containing protein n=1 Tax=Streptomyces sp. NBC_01304 TaxID=2903818 RepID=UPI002E0ED647|nr:hypothetical protein OG430_04730 [Streptomyces sp. NBC_01304]
MGLATALAMGLSLVTVQSAAADEIGGETFMGATIDQSKWYGGPYTENDPTGWACLTASTATPKPLEGCQKHDGMPPPDAPGKGALRLTSNKKLQNGYAISKNAVPTKDGLKFSIDFGIYQPGEPNDPADGIALMLLDGGAEMPKKSGKNGSGLGYVGIKGGYVGVGLDVYGNFTDSHNDAGAEGGLSDRTGNSITIRGAEATKNAMIATYKSGRRLAPSGAKTREEARRTATLELSKEGVMRVFIDFHDGQPPREVIEPVDIHSIKGQPAVPDSLRIGFSASTGNSTAIHELWGGKVETLGPDLSTKVEANGTVKAGEPAEFTMTTSNNKAAGPTNGEVTTTQTFPEGIKPVSASGDGWTCTVEGQTVTCKRPGDGAGALKPGESFPPVLVKTEVAKDAKGDKEITSQATTPGESQPKPETSPVSITPAKGPDLTVTTKPKGDVTAGEPAEYTIDVANKPEAGPTDGEVKVVRTFPAGVKPTEAAGPGWKCAIDGQTVTCTRPGTGADVLNPGKNYPPITVKTAVDGAAAGELEGTTQVTTPSSPNTTPVKDTTTVKPAPAKGPNLSVVTQPVGDVVAGQPAKFVIGVANAPDAGPTTGEVKVVRTFPAGVKPIKASGSGWDCKVDGQTVTCTRPGTGADVLNPGRSYPPITVETAVDKGASGELTGTTQAGTNGQVSKEPVKDTVSVVPASTKEPDLTVVTKPQGEVVAGRPATFHVDVSNAADAGPTHAVVTVKRTFPDGVVPKVALGAGWDCKIDGQTVTCTRPGTGEDALQPGKQYPSIKVTTAVAADAPESGEGTTTVTTEGDPDGDKGVPDTITITPGETTPGGSVSCYGGTARISLKPGLGIGDKLQNFTGSGTSGGCTSNGSSLQPTSVEISYNASGNGSCFPSKGIPNGTMTGVMRWTVNGKVVTSKVEGRARFSMWGSDFDGVVTDGAYKGMKVHGTAEWDIASTIIPGTAQCILGGHTEASGTWAKVTVSEG